MIAPALALRSCSSLDEFHTCVDLQREIWGFHDDELVPLRMFSLATKIGGQVIGAWDAGVMVGFALAIPGCRNGHCYLHSHMVGVKERYRNTGLGRQIKLFQRQDALARGYELMEWTFDPLEIKNAYFNLQRLGAIARRYNINQYGITSSPLQGFLPTDRLVAEWWMNSGRVHRVLESGVGEMQPELRISVPSAIYAWKADAALRSRAAEVQARNREQFLGAFSQGMACLGYERDAQGNGTFLLGHWDEDWTSTISEKR